MVVEFRINCWVFSFACTFVVNPDREVTRLGLLSRIPKRTSRQSRHSLLRELSLSSLQQPWLDLTLVIMFCLLQRCVRPGTCLAGRPADGSTRVNWAATCKSRSCL